MKRHLLNSLSIISIYTILCCSAFANSAIERVVERNQEDTKSFNIAPLKGHSFGLGLGQTFLQGDFSKNGQNGITIDAYYEYNASYSFDLVVNGHYSSHEMGVKSTTILGLAAGIKGKVLNYDSFTPFFIGGLGFYNPSVTRLIDGIIVESDSKITFGTHFGAGADLELNRNYTVGILAHFHNPFDIDQELAPEIEGFYYKMLFTLAYKF